MTEAEYVTAYRFGFGVMLNKTFDPAAELADLPTENTSLAQQLGKRIVDAKLQQKAYTDSGRSDAEHMKLQAIYRSSEIGDLHRVITDAATTDAMFIYRLSAFWANHFSFGRSKPICGLSAVCMKPRCDNRCLVRSLIS